MAYSSRAMQQQAGVAVFVVLAAALILGVAAQNNPSTACGQYEIPLENCLGFLTNTAQTPSTSCCSAISQVQKESVTCLCSIVTNIGTSVPINVTRAKEIPQDCNLGFTNTVCEAAPSPSLGSSKPSQPGAASTITPSWLANLVAGAMALVAVSAFVHAP
ncbi:unnamed protein product [Sphagnum jensenii]|uniref:Bifunctional inhibitor/plant lipid transfer protein/seed storage helical domain-containing protein n=1 Tax=Sphagnum jensenii TaxID=128206 RepID=A0ABP1B348_9BRYO